jgi:putative addiction module component (TIGR02574 family)
LIARLTASDRPGDIDVPIANVALPAGTVYNRAAFWQECHMTTYASILQEAMKLSPRERSQLAEALWETVDEWSDEELLAQMSDAQRAQIARRSAEIDAGTAKYVTWEQMVERARRAAGHNG